MAAKIRKINKKRIIRFRIFVYCIIFRSEFGELSIKLYLCASKQFITSKTNTLQNEQRTCN